MAQISCPVYKLEVLPGREAGLGSMTGVRSCIGQCEVSNCILHHFFGVYYFLFYYHLYLLLLLDSILFSIVKLLSQPTSFTFNFFSHSFGMQRRLGTEQLCGTYLPAGLKL